MDQELVVFVSNALEAEGQAMQFDDRGWVLHEVLLGCISLGLVESRALQRF